MSKTPKEPKPSSDPKVVALRADREAAKPKPWEYAQSKQKAQKPRPKQQLRRRP